MSLSWNYVLKNTFGRRRVGVIGEWGISYKEELTILKVVELVSLRWTEHVERRRKEMVTLCW
jgi:hypothetical protein